MRLGINLGYWGLGMDADNIAVAQEADRLGYSVCWAAEAYGSDAATVLSYVAAKTERIDVGSAIFQIPARTPAMTAMTAATLDTLSGGRFRLGLGVSGPQVSEGWYGVKFDKPLARTREYVEIIRKAMSRERLVHEGASWTLPLPGGPGKPLKLTVHPVREHIPLYIAAIGPKNLEQTGEIADGWLGIFFAPEHAALSLEPLKAKPSQGRADPGRLRPLPDRDHLGRRGRQGRRGHPALLRRALHRRHGQQGQELLQPADPSDGLRAGRRRDPGEVPRQGLRRRRRSRPARADRLHLAARRHRPDRGPDAGLRGQPASPPSRWPRPASPWRSASWRCAPAWRRWSAPVWRSRRRCGGPAAPGPRGRWALRASRCA